MASFGKKKGAEVASKINTDNKPPSSPNPTRPTLTKGDSVTALGLTPLQIYEMEEKRQKQEAEKEEQRQKEEAERQRLEQLRQQQEEQARLVAEWSSRRAKLHQWQLEDDGAQLAELTPDPDVSYAPLSASVYESYSKLTDFTRGLNTERSWTVPELVLIGPEGCGKTAVLETLLGFGLLSSPNRRPLFVHQLNNPDCQEPRVTIKRDAALDGAGDQMLPSSLAALPAELERRNAIDSDEPIVVRLEHRTCFTATFIDTPGLSEGRPERERLALELLEPRERLLLFVDDAPLSWDQESLSISAALLKRNHHQTQLGSPPLVAHAAAADHPHNRLLQLAESVDPKLTRSVFVYTKFNYVLRTFENVRELNSYLSGRPPAKAKTFFTSLFSRAVHDNAASDPVAFQTKVAQSSRRDLQLMDKLNYNPKAENIVGVRALRKHVTDTVFRRYQDSIPDLLKQIRALKKDANDQLDAVRQQIRTLDKHKVRVLATQYVAEYVQNLVSLMEGSNEGNVHRTANGQTLDDEKQATGRWLDADGRPLVFDHASVAHADSKLYGGQQVERLLAEFRCVATETVRVTRLNMDDVATAAGLSGLKSSSNLVWAASDLVQQKCTAVFVPLIKQLFRRAIYICKRLTSITESMMNEAKRGGKVAGRAAGHFGTTSDTLSLPAQFTWYVKDMFESFVDECAEQCFVKCSDELACTQLLFWELRTRKQASASFAKSGLAPVQHDTVEALAAEIFNEHKSRITDNILLKVYDFYLVKMQKTVSGAIQRQLSVIPDEELERMFDIDSTIARLKEEERSLEKLAQVDKEGGFMEAASKFRV